MVRGDVLAGDVRNKSLEAITLIVNNEAGLSFLFATSELLRRQKHPQLEWHVKPRQPGRRVKLRTRNIVYSEPTLGDNFEDFRRANLTSVTDLKGAAGDEPAVMDREDDCPKETLISPVERAVDENAFFELGCSNRWHSKTATTFSPSPFCFFRQHCETRAERIYQFWQIS